MDVATRARVDKTLLWLTFLLPVSHFVQHRYISGDSFVASFEYAVATLIFFAFYWAALLTYRCIRQAK